MALEIQALSVQAIKETACPWWAGLLPKTRAAADRLREMADEIEESISE